MEERRARQILDYVDPDRAIKLTQEMIRIPSLTYEESQVADYIADYLADVGIDFRMVDVADPLGSEKVSRQPVGIIPGDGSGPSLMFNGHMDTGPMAGTRAMWAHDPFGGENDGTYIYGVGATNEKGGVAAFLTAGEAIKNSGIKLKGDLLLCPVAAHVGAAAGTVSNHEQGTRADMCINTECTNLHIVSCGVGSFTARIILKGQSTHFATSPEAKARAAFPISQMCQLVAKLGPDIQPIPEGGWLTYTPEPDLPGFPQHMVLDIEAGSPFGDEYCTIVLQVRSVPGQTAETFRHDLERLVTELGQEVANVAPTIEVPVKGGWQIRGYDKRLAGFPKEPYKIPRDHLLPVTVARWHEFVSGRAAEVGAGDRLGATGDAGYLVSAGTPSVQYGPSAATLYERWPAINERIKIEDLLIATRVLALSAAEICGA